MSPHAGIALLVESWKRCWKHYTAVGIVPQCLSADDQFNRKDLTTEKSCDDSEKASAMFQNVQLWLECPLVLAAVFICGIGGTFQYGFSISSLTSPSAFIQELMNTTSVQRYGVKLEQWQISLIWSFTVSIFCIGGLVSALLANTFISKFGRQKTLLLTNIPALIGAVLMLSSKAAESFEMIFVARFLFGANSGLSLITHTIYVVECAPKQLRVMAGVTVAIFVALGKFSGQVLGTSELLGSRERWPWLLGFTGLTSLLQLVTLPLLPESPSFLLLVRGDHQACERGNEDTRNTQKD